MSREKPKKRFLVGYRLDMDMEISVEAETKEEAMKAVDDMDVLKLSDGRALYTKVVVEYAREV